MVDTRWVVPSRELGPIRVVCYAYRRACGFNLHCNRCDLIGRLVLAMFRGFIRWSKTTSGGGCSIWAGGSICVDFIAEHLCPCVYGGDNIVCTSMGLAVPRPTAERPGVLWWGVRSMDDARRLIVSVGVVVTIEDARTRCRAELNSPAYGRGVVKFERSRPLERGFDTPARDRAEVGLISRA